MARVAGALLIAFAFVAVFRLSLGLSISTSSNRRRVRDDAGTASDGGIGSLVRVPFPSVLACFFERSATLRGFELAETGRVMPNEGDKREATNPNEVTS